MIPAVENIQKSFLELLNNYLPKKILEKAKSGARIKILSIGCGRFREAKCLFEYFKVCNDFIKLYGIDVEEELINLAKEDPAIKNNAGSVSLKIADAQEIENYKEWLKDGPFELVIVRHPEITFNTEVFMKIFSLVRETLLNKEGVLFITTHFENEKETIKLLLQMIKLNILTEAENSLAQEMEVNGKKSYADKFLLIGQKI